MTAEDEGNVAPLSCNATEQERQQHYNDLKERITLLIADETDLIAVMATLSSELHHAFDYYHWTGFYQICKATRSSLVIGPYQGSLGCLRIPIGTGVCGTAALKRETQLVPDVHKFSGHIACSSTTKSEVVVPYFSGGGELLGVLDVDSNLDGAFTDIDKQGLETLCSVFRRWNIFHEYVA